MPSCRAVADLGCSGWCSPDRRPRSARDHVAEMPRARGASLFIHKCGVCVCVSMLHVGSKVPVRRGELIVLGFVRGSVRTATALPDRRNASAGPCPIRPQVGLAPHSGTDIAQEQEYPSSVPRVWTANMLRAGPTALLLPVAKPEDPNA